MKTWLCGMLFLAWSSGLLATDQLTQNTALQGNISGVSDIAMDTQTYSATFLAAGATSAQVPALNASPIATLTIHDNHPAGFKISIRSSNIDSRSFGSSLVRDVTPALSILNAKVGDVITYTLSTVVSTGADGVWGGAVDPLTAESAVENPGLTLANITVPARATYRGVIALKLNIPATSAPFAGNFKETLTILLTDY